MRLSGLLFTLAAVAPVVVVWLPSCSAIECAGGTLIPNAAGQVDLNNGIVMSYTCPTESTGCTTAFMRQGFATEEASRLVIVSCQTGTCQSTSQVVAPNYWYDIRCCTSNNCNLEGLNNIDWSDRTPNINGEIPTFPSFPTFSIPTTATATGQPTDEPTDTPTTDPSTAPTQSPGTILRCRQGTTSPSGNGQIGPDTASWKSDTCQVGQTFCVTFFERTNENKLIMANCAETCTPAVLVTSTTTWMETTCCTSDNCNNDINKLSNFDWGERSMNATATQAPTSGTQSPTQSPTASPISGTTSPATTIPNSTSTGINNIAFPTAVFSPRIIFILACVSFATSF